MTPDESAIYSAVILQAMRDYNFHLRGVPINAGTIQDGIDAERFLTAAEGKWSQSRFDVCHAAGICPDSVRARVLAAIERDGDLRSLLPSDVREPRKRKVAEAA